ncbi:MAG: hypothetical protein ACRC8K_19860, partial [Waterburya sp.]
VNSSVMTLDNQQAVQTITAPTRKVIGVGNVGREPGKATYTLLVMIIVTTKFCKYYCLFL